MLEKVNEIYKSMEDIEYGWFDKNHQRHEHITEGYLGKFRMQTNEEIEKSRVGVCWETVELTRYLLEKNNIPCKTYFFVIPIKNFYCHSVLVINENNKFYWIENSFKDFKGIRKFDTLESLLFFVIDNFSKIVGSNNYNIKQMKLFEYKKPNDSINCFNFYIHCFNSKKLTSKYINKYLKIIEEKKN